MIIYFLRPLIGENERKNIFKNKQLAIFQSLEIKPEKIEMFRTGDPSTFSNKEFKNWLEWWESNFSIEDYFKYLSTQVQLDENIIFDFI